ncbi:GtrA family protein [Candidatus Woesearchaeota archaeon]|nr:GtrA family protein [Candidatus Woesearchaeota archaeon]
MKIFKINNQLITVFLKFAVIGGVSTIINYSVFLLLLSIGVNYIISSAFGYMSGVLFGFVFNRKITFKSEGDKKTEVLKYFAVYLISLFLGVSILRFLVEILSIPAWFSNILVICFTTMTNFLGAYFVVFNKKAQIPMIFRSNLFLAVLVLKIILSFLFGSDYLVDGTIPFVNYFIESGFKNPYAFFYSINQLKVFPYPPVMLYILSVFRILSSFIFTADWRIIQPVHLFIFRLPLLFGDLIIYYVLSQIAKPKEKLVTLFYWCSPVLIYISYFHGQLDVLPIALLMLSIYFLYRNLFFLSSVFLGISIATKTHIVLVLPLYFIYLWKQRIPIKKVILNNLAVIVTYALLLVPFMFSEGFINLVFKAEEQFRIFNLYILLTGGDVKLYILPSVFLIFFLSVSIFKNMNKDLFMMAITILYTSLVIFISPMPGWYYWSVPFIVFFLVKEGRLGHYLTYGLLNIFYLSYFLLNSSSDVFQSFQVISPFVANLPGPYNILLGLGINAKLISNIFITFLTATLGIIVFWIYNQGIRNNLNYNLAESPLFIGVAGDSSSGKTTLTNLIESMTDKINLTIIKGDDVHKWERDNKNWEKYTHLDPKANLIHQNYRHAKKLVNGEKISRKVYDHDTGKFTSPVKFYAKRFVVFEGLHEFFASGLRDIYDLKIFLDTDEDLRRYWKIKRDMKKRGYSKEKVIESLDRRKSDSMKYIMPQAKFADILIRYEPSENISEGQITDKEIEFKVVMKLKEYINIESLSEYLNSFEGMNFSYGFEPEKFQLKCEFTGSLAKEDVKKIAYSLIPNLRDLLNNFEPEWYEDKNGVLQLIILLYIEEILRKKVENPK